MLCRMQLMSGHNRTYFRLGHCPTCHQIRAHNLRFIPDQKLYFSLFMTRQHSSLIHHPLTAITLVVVGVDGAEHGLVVHDQHQGPEGDVEHVDHHLEAQSCLPRVTRSSANQKSGFWRALA